MAEGLTVVDALSAFAPGQPLRGALFLTYTFDGFWFEEAIAPVLFDRPVEACLLVRDGRAVLREAPSVRYLRQDAVTASKIFHPKLIILIAEDRAFASIGSANLSKGGYERNLELGHVFEIGPDGGPRTLFTEIEHYLQAGIRRELSAETTPALDEILLALQDVIKSTPKESESPIATLLHNYDTCIWEQLLAKVPHRYLSRAIVVSPFFDRVGAASIESEDPPANGDTAPCFEKLLEDFRFEPTTGSRPVVVDFQENEGQTNLPIDLLRRYESLVELRIRDVTGSDSRPLHGKLLLLEGAEGKGRQPYCLALSGSPNFTRSALLITALTGNAELALLTSLPPKRGMATRAANTLSLDTRFRSLPDWSLLRTVPPASIPDGEPSLLLVLGATLLVSDQILRLHLRATVSSQNRLRVSIGTVSNWTVIAETDWSGEEYLAIAVKGAMATEGHSELRSLRGSSVLLEALAADGTVLAVAVGPLNVDQPMQFCGLSLVGPLLLTLDQRIAQAGSGLSASYREQLRFLEGLRVRSREQKDNLNALRHHADLDLFFRNVYRGIRGLRRRRKSAPDSVYTLRRNCRELGRWLGEAATSESQVISLECRLFLVRLLAHEIKALLEDPLAIRRDEAIRPLLQDLQLDQGFRLAQDWVTTCSDQDVMPYVDEVGALLIHLARVYSSERPAV